MWAQYHFYLSFSLFGILVVALKYLDSQTECGHLTEAILCQKFIGLLSYIRVFASYACLAIDVMQVSILKKIFKISLI